MENKLIKNLWLLGALILHILFMTAGSSWGSLSGTLDYRVESIEDDAEQFGVSTNRDIYDLELGDKLCGIRFKYVKIPKGSTITKAYIQFAVDEARLDVTDLTIWGQLHEDAKEF